MLTECWAKLSETAVIHYVHFIIRSRDVQLERDRRAFRTLTVHLLSSGNKFIRFR